MDDSKQLTFDELDFAVGGAVQINPNYSIKPVPTESTASNAVHFLKVTLPKLDMLANLSMHLPWTRP